MYVSSCVPVPSTFLTESERQHGVGHARRECLLGNRHTDHREAPTGRMGRVTHSPFSHRAAAQGQLESQTIQLPDECPDPELSPSVTLQDATVWR